MQPPNTITKKMVGERRFELPASWSRTKRATKLRYSPTFFPLLRSSWSPRINCPLFYNETRLRSMQGLSLSLFKKRGGRRRLFHPGYPCSDGPQEGDRG
jgi:hypothetical protein